MEYIIIYLIFALIVGVLFAWGSSPYSFIMLTVFGFIATPLIVFIFIAVKIENFLNTRRL